MPVFIPTDQAFLRSVSVPYRVKIKANSGGGDPAAHDAGMMELVDMRDLGSRAFRVWVRVPLPVPNKKDAVIPHPSLVLFKG